MSEIVPNCHLPTTYQLRVCKENPEIWNMMKFFFCVFEKFMQSYLFPSFMRVCNRLFQDFIHTETMWGRHCPVNRKTVWGFRCVFTYLQDIYLAAVDTSYLSLPHSLKLNVKLMAGGHFSVFHLTGQISLHIVFHVNSMHKNRVTACSQRRENEINASFQ